MFFWWNKWKANRDGSWKDVNLDADLPKVTEAYPWMADADDYGPLQDFPDQSAPDHVVDEYIRKMSARGDATVEFDELEEQLAPLRGISGDPAPTKEERELTIQNRAREIAERVRHEEKQVTRERRQRRLEQQRHDELVSAIENSTAFGAGRKFAKDHPFLAGVIGADITHRLKDK